MKQISVFFGILSFVAFPLALAFFDPRAKTPITDQVIFQETFLECIATISEETDNRHLSIGRCEDAAYKIATKYVNKSKLER